MSKFGKVLNNTQVFTIQKLKKEVEDLTLLLAVMVNKTEDGKIIISQEDVKSLPQKYFNVTMGENNEIVMSLLDENPNLNKS